MHQAHPPFLVKGPTLAIRRTQTKNQKASSQRNSDSYGPGGDGVLAVLDRLRNTTTTEVAGLVDVHDATQTEEWARARRAAWDATWMAGRVSNSDLAIEEVRLVSVIVGLGDRSDSVEGAAEAAVVHDLIGQNGYTKDDHRTLTGPWRSVMGIWNGAAWLRRVA